MSYILYQGDCLPILQSLPENSIDAIITDPPYSSGGFGNSVKRKDTQAKYRIASKINYPLFFGDNKDQLSHTLWLSQILSSAYMSLKDGGLVLLFSDWRQFSATELAVQMAGFTLRGVAVWDKTKCARPNPGFFSQQAEFVILASKGTPATWQNAFYPHGLFTCAPLKGGKFHQTGKPVDVMKWLVAVVPYGGTVLDPFMGSGSTGVACLETGRKFIGCELSTDYIKIAQQRLNQATAA